MGLDAVQAAEQAGCTATTAQVSEDVRGLGPSVVPQGRHEFQKLFPIIARKFLQCATFTVFENFPTYAFYVTNKFFFMNHVVRNRGTNKAIFGPLRIF